MEKITKKCKCCRKEITVRLADHNRGWGNFCNKSCKAKFQSKATGITGPDYKAIGKTVNQMRNGNYAKSQFNGSVKKYSRCCDVCGETATVAYYDSFGENGKSYYCDDHDDDTHPFDIDQWND